ncbi:unnamed protein product [Somion occarium]|uniref:MYND-type domain-containing protein n=1 Tax=Somion occarium TaxID=3059160 RepID=A0ABP1D2A8_9APHY
MYTANIPGMAPRTHISIRKIPKDVIQQQPNFGEYMIECSKYLTESKSEDILAPAREGDTALRLELAIRYLSACGTRRKSADGALFFLDMITDPKNLEYLAGVSRDIMAKALSCTAFAYYDKYLFLPEAAETIEADEVQFNRPKAPGDPILGNLYLAARYADASARRGFVSPAVLDIGFLVQGLSDQVRINLTQAPRFRVFQNLWRVCNDRQAEILEEERQRRRKAAKAPNAYICAAEGCGITGEKKAVLRACAGKCPPDLKPHYCSKACQTKDWPRHKPICKPGAKPSKSTALVLSDMNKLRLDEPGALLTLEDEDLDPREGPGCSIDIPAPNLPGGKMHIISQNLSPEFLKQFRNATHDIVSTRAADGSGSR